MTKREEIIQEYHCYDSHGELCCDCDECKKALADDLDDFESEIRADERRKFLTWLEGYKMGDELCIYPYDRAKVIEMYEKEQK